MKQLIFAALLLLVQALFMSSSTYADKLQIKQLKGGILRIQSKAGVDFLIKPNKDAQAPNLQDRKSYVLGSVFEPERLSWSGKPTNQPSGGIRITSEKVGSKDAAIRLSSKDIEVLVVSLDVMSAQGFIKSGKPEDLNLMILTVENPKHLTNARTNLWMSRYSCMQIALNAVASLDKQAAQQFHKSLKRNRTLPSAIIPMTMVPMQGLKFGDQQTIQLKQLD